MSSPPIFWPHKFWPVLKQKKLGKISVTKYEIIFFRFSNPSILYIFEVYDNNNNNNEIFGLTSTNIITPWYLVLSYQSPPYKLCMRQWWYSKIFEFICLITLSVHTNVFSENILSFSKFVSYFTSYQFSFCMIISCWNISYFFHDFL